MGWDDFFIGCVSQEIIGLTWIMLNAHLLGWRGCCKYKSQHTQERTTIMASIVWVIMEWKKKRYKHCQGRKFSKVIKNTTLSIFIRSSEYININQNTKMARIYFNHFFQCWKRWKIVNKRHKLFLINMTIVHNISYWFYSV